MINSLLSVVLPNIARTYRMINQYVTIIKHNFDALEGRRDIKTEVKQVKNKNSKAVTWALLLVIIPGIDNEPACL